MSASAMSSMNDVKPEEGDICQSFHCSVCLGLIEEPRILPGCGHSFCSRCLSALLSNLPATTRQVGCPECRKTSQINPIIGADGLGVNASLKEAASVIKKYHHNNNNNHHYLVVTSPMLCPHVPFVTETGFTCLHCGEEFCGNCQVIHIEIMRLEINFMSSGFRAREDAIEKVLDIKIASAKNHIESMSSAIVKKVNESDEKSYPGSGRKSKENLLQRANQFRDEKIKQLNNLGGVFPKLLENRDQLEKRINEVMSMSPICVDLAKVAQLYEDVFEIDSKLWKMEHFYDQAMKCRIFYQPPSANPKPQSKKARKFSANIHIESDYDLEAPFKVEKIPSEIKLLQKAARNGELALLKSIILRSGLTSGCRRFVINCKFGKEPNLTMLCVEAKNAREIVQFLAEQGAKLDLEHNCQTVLHRAILGSSDPGLIETLLDLCPDLAKPSGGSSPYDFAIVAGKTDFAEILKKREKGTED